MDACPKLPRIDFIAYHNLQAQTGESVFEELQKKYDCQWLIGPDQKPSGAKAAVILDHRCFQPKIKKEVGGYQFLFHLTHDLSDLSLYNNEYLQDIDILFVPTETHYNVARHILGQNTNIVVSGWPKFDRLNLPFVDSNLYAGLQRLPHPITILYVPTWAHTREWRDILPFLFRLSVNVIVKNHIYVNPGQPFPPGQEELYRECLESAQQMERFAEENAANGNVLVAPRTLNVCMLFPYAQILITDTSSCALEFLPFGASIETGAGINEIPAPDSSVVTSEVYFLPLHQLRQTFSNTVMVESFLREHLRDKPQNTFIQYDPKIKAGEVVCGFIDACLSGFCQSKAEQDRPDKPEVMSMFCKENDLKPILGFDSDGEVFSHNGQIYRGIFPGKGTRAKKILDYCQSGNLFDYGIVRTSVTSEVELAQMGYDLVFEHERVPYITYAHEWPTEMFQDAAMFQIDLSLELSRYDIWLKDCGVQSNVLFDATRPVFVDFLSLCTSGELLEQEFLKPMAQRSPFSELWSESSTYFNEIFERMFYPYFLYPLYMMHQGRYSETRKRLLETALNTCFDKITVEEAFVQADELYNGYLRCLAAREYALVSADWTRFLKILKAEVEGLQPVTTSSAYTSYYDLKNENYDFRPSADWGHKQRTVYYALLAFAPETVLDVGANTGWFSLLAAKLGSKVVSLDIDEASMNVLYRTAKKSGLPILPLVIDIANLSGDVAPFFGYEQDEHMLQSRLTTTAPMLLSAEKRLQCDLVLALALVHHLCLGNGMFFSEVVSRLAAFAIKHLVLEFVPKDDSLVKSEPEFFPAYCNNPHLFDWYHLDNMTKELRGHFARIEVSEASTGRVLILCSR